MAVSISTQNRVDVSNLYVALFGRAPDGEGLGYWSNEIFKGATLAAVADAMFATPAARAYYPAYQTNEEIVGSFYKNVLGRTADTEGLSYWEGKLNTADATVGSVITEMLDVITNWTDTTDSVGVASAALFKAKADVALTYGLANASIAQATGALTPFTGVATTAAALADAVAAAKALLPSVSAGQTFTLTTGAIAGGSVADNLTGTAFDDTFLARTVNNVNTLQDGDKIDGGAGTDSLVADMAVDTVAITPVLTNIESVYIRAQSVTLDVTNGNNMQPNTVQIDAQRSLAVNSLNTVTAEKGVTRWESNNSRSDVVIEDVRIGNGQKTIDVTIAMVETDPGNVDYAVYFDQLSLRNFSTGSTSLTINVMDSGAAAATATSATPLLNNPYDTFVFYQDGVKKTIALDKEAVKAADTYALLLAVFQTALTDTGFTATLGANFTITDPISNKAVTGQSILLTGPSNSVITTPDGSGWFNTTGASVPATSNMYTTYTAGTTSVAELVTSKVILDDVGRGSTGGDLVIGGMSVGDTSTSRGVERFEITVEDNSKLQTINSTNNALREVTIVNVTTSKTVKDAGNLTVNGDANALPSSDGQTNLGSNNLLAGVEDNSPVGIHHGFTAAGFTDVRLIDGSAMKGTLAFTAAITADSIAKYITGVDQQANPAADIAGTGNINLNVPGANFVYSGGTNNDTLVVTIDTAAVASRSTVVSGLSDFTFNVSGNAGNDAITLTVENAGLAGGAQAWYNNQKLNANIFVNGNDGNDTIRTPGAGDVIIDAGTGDDTVYTDNTGALAVTANSTGSAGTAALAYSNAAAAELAAAQAARVAGNTTGFVHNDGVAIGVSLTPAAVVAGLATLDQLTPTNPPSLPVITHAALAAGTAAAAAAGVISLAQKVALDAAYNSATGGVVTPGALGAAATLASAVAVAGNVTAAELSVGNALLGTYVAAANAALAAATANDANVGVHNALLNTTQLAVVNATAAVNAVDDSATPANEAGTATIVAGLAALQSAIALNATALTVTAALDAATLNGSITPAQAVALNTAIGSYPVSAAGLTAVTAILSPMQNTANLVNASAQAALTAAVTADANAVNAAAKIVAAAPTGFVTTTTGGVTTTAATTGSVFDSLGSAGAAAAAAAAATASTRAAADVAAAQAINTALNGLKTVVNVNSLTADVTNALDNAFSAIAAAIGYSASTGNGAVTVNPLAAAYTPLVIAAGSPVTAAAELTFDTGPLGVYSATSIDALVINNTRVVDQLTLVAANAAAIATATATASTIAAAATASGPSTLTLLTAAAQQKAVFVFNTTNQTGTYNASTMDDRSLADLRSDANSSYNFFSSTLKVTYKGIDVSVPLAGTGYKTTDLEINQAIKKAINDTTGILSKLLVATDGPGNTLVVTSLIDGAQATGNLAVSITMPAAGVLSVNDIAGAASAYGLPAGTTEATLLATIATAKTAFDVKADYATRFAESGAGAGSATLTGANSTSSSDNTVTPGTGNDVIVLGTTVGTDLMTSSNETIVLSGEFGNDTIVNFATTGLGYDTLNFTALGGSGAAAFGSYSADRSIVVAAPTAAGATVLSAAQIAALFTDSTTAITHIYVAVDATNIGSIWQVTDGAGAGNVVAKYTNSSIDLSDTVWATLTSANFSGYAGVTPVAPVVPVTPPTVPVVPVTPVVPVVVVPVAPNYAVAATATSFNEGTSATFTVTTTGVANGATVAYTLAGTNQGAADFTAPVPLTVTINNNTGTITVPLLADNLTEATAETLMVTLTPDTTKTATATITDFSKTPVAPASTALPVGSSAPVVATAGADVYSLVVAGATGALASGPNTQVTITGFAPAQDALVFDLITALGAKTLASLVGVEGITVQVNGIASNTTVNFGPDATGDIVTITLAGVTDPTLVNVTVI